MAKMNNSSLYELECPEHSDEDLNLLTFITFWVQGVLESVVAITGFIANVVSAYILTRYVLGQTLYRVDQK